MELLKVDETPAEFKWKDITILYRTRMSEGDKFDIDTSGAYVSGDKIQFNKWELCRTIIRTFVVGWRGVTEDGKEVPYSFDTLLKRLPSDGTEDLIMALGLKIVDDTGFIKEKKAEGSDLKNG